MHGLTPLALPFILLLIPFYNLIKWLGIEEPWDGLILFGVPMIAIVSVPILLIRIDGWRRRRDGRSSHMEEAWGKQYKK